MWTVEDAGTIIKSLKWQFLNNIQRKWKQDDTEYTNDLPPNITALKKNHQQEQWVDTHIHMRFIIQKCCLLSAMAMYL